MGTSPKGLQAPIEKAVIGLVADAQNGGYKLVDAEALNKCLNDKKEWSSLIPCQGGFHQNQDQGSGQRTHAQVDSQDRIFGMAMKVIE